MYPYSHINIKNNRKIKKNLLRIKLHNKNNMHRGTLTAAKPESKAAGPPDSNFKSSINTNIQVDTL